MDVNSILPLLMRKAGGGNDKMNTLLQMARGEKPDMETVMQMAMENRQKKNALSGLSPIAEIASYTVMGKLIVYFLRNATA